MATQLTLYNGALSKLGERALTTLIEDREPRHVLDGVWSRDFKRRVLQMGQWNFATRTIMPSVSASVTPSFGYRNAFEKPSDHVRTTGLCQDEYFKVPLTDYTDETGYWFADLDIIYVRYVSDDNLYGGDLSLWPPNFVTYAEYWLANEIAPTVAGLEFDGDKFDERVRKALREAQATDAMEQPAATQPAGSWVNARAGRRSLLDRGTRKQLIG